MHIPVLLQPSIENLQLQPGLRVLDATLGLAGHAEAFLAKIIPEGFLVGIDQDQRNLEKAESRLSPFAQNTKLIHTNFADLDQLAFTEKFDRIFFDLGVSSPHLDEAERGFSFRQDGPLDMRMNLDQDFTAADLVNTYSERELFRVIKDYGEEPMAYLIAKMIVKKRQIRPWTSTQELATAIDDLLFKNKNRHKHPA
ncbi:MAG TPA: 16S rRNA (cytosine(1402)-N(4))-methyltransferase RsmH, partial [Candidatus Gracilibacteria bacterium]|nr:16S rRNA (cytosine(1402)-N(4))-methyltransferase RsmH [Candidatus Gracilibacteria bacterium]